MRFLVRFALYQAAVCTLAALPAFTQSLPVWGSVPTPNNGDLQNEFLGVAPVSANDVWAVGDYNSGVVPTVTGRRAAVKGNTGASQAVVNWFGPTSGSVSCDVSGNFVIADLPAGTYNLTADLVGCAPAVAALTVSANTTAHQNLPISCGAR